MAETLDADPVQLETAATRYYRMVLESAWARARAQHPGTWRPETEVEGFERLQQAVDAGTGVVLWRLSFCSTLVVKIALWRAGVHLVHLSRAEHGADSNGWAARKVIAPKYRRAEDPYLAERVVIPWGGSPVAATRRLLACLERERGIVSVVGDLPGIQPVTVPFFDARALFAAGAPMLAARTGAVLLPTYAVWLGPGRYRVVIEEPIGLDASPDRRTRVEGAVHRFVDRAQGAIRRHPESWMGWGRFWGGSPPYQRDEIAHRPSR